MKRRSKEVALIIVAGGLLAFELVAIAGALPVVRRAMSRVSHTNVRVIEVNQQGQVTRSKSLVVSEAANCPVADMVKQALL